MKKNNNFHLIRLLAATLVIYGHSFDLLRAPGGVGWFYTEVSASAVQIFFVISGYLICASWNNDPSLIRYFTKRALRIFPALIILSVLTVFVLGPILTKIPRMEYLQNSSTYGYFWNIALAPRFALPGVFASNPFPVAVNGSLWTLPAEFLMYILLPIYAWRRHAIFRCVIFPAAFAASLAAAYYYAWVAPGKIGPVVYWSSIPQILQWSPYFLGGVAFSFWRLEKILRIDVAVILIGALTCLAPLGASVEGLAVSICLPYIVLAVCLPKEPSLYKWKADISYGVYLYAFPIQQTIIYLLGAKLSPLCLFAVTLPIVYGLGYLSWTLIEKPALSLKPWRKRTDNQSDPLPEPVAYEVTAR